MCGAGEGGWHKVESEMKGKTLQVEGKLGLFACLFMAESEVGLQTQL
jgi:hypothetical protein